MYIYICLINIHSGNRFYWTTLHIRFSQEQLLASLCVTMSPPCREKILILSLVSAMNNFTTLSVGYVLWNFSLTYETFIIFWELIKHGIKYRKDIVPIQYPLHLNSTSNQIKIVRHKDWFQFPSFLFRNMMSFFKTMSGSSSLKRARGHMRLEDGSPKKWVLSKTHWSRIWAIHQKKCWNGA